MSYQIVVTYDTGDTFNQEHDVEGTIERSWQNDKKSRGYMEWEDLDKAKRALKDIEEHYHCYMMLHKEWNAGADDKVAARKKAEESPWYSVHKEDSSLYYNYWEFNISLEDDNGERIFCDCFWTGYFENMVGADIIATKDDKLGFRV